MIAGDDDARLMLQYRNGDVRAFMTLYSRHKLPLYRYLLRQVRNSGAAADLFQEVWSRVVANRERYEARAKFTTYLFHIAHNCAMDFFRELKQRQAPRAEPPFLDEPQVPEEERPDALLESAEQGSALLQALGALPREQREVFLLYEESGLSIEEIARLTEVGTETAKSRLRYAVRKLKHALTRSDAAIDALAHPRDLKGTRADVPA